MDELLKMCLIVCPLIFLGGFVDSVAGGGGLITLPAYMMAGVPVHFAAGTNKLRFNSPLIIAQQQPHVLAEIGLKLRYLAIPAGPA